MRIVFSDEKLEDIEFDSKEIHIRTILDTGYSFVAVDSYLFYDISSFDNNDEIKKRKNWKDCTVNSQSFHTVSEAIEWLNISTSELKKYLGSH